MRNRQVKPHPSRNASRKQHSKTTDNPPKNPLSSTPENPDPVSQGILVSVSRGDGQAIGLFELPEPTSARLRDLANAGYEGRVESVIEGAIELRLMEHPLPAHTERLVKEAESLARIDAEDKLSHAVSNCLGLFDLLLHRLCFDKDGNRQVSETLEFGLYNLCEGATDRLRSASRELCQFIKPV